MDELLIVDPEQHKIDWLGLAEGSHQPIAHSSLIDLGAAELAQRIDWP